AQYIETEPETYVLPLTVSHGAEAERALEQLPHAVVARLTGDEPSVLSDATWDPGFCSALLAAIARGEAFAGQAGTLAAVGLGALAEEIGDACLVPTLSK